MLLSPLELAFCPLNRAPGRPAAAWHPEVEKAGGVLVSELAKWVRLSRN